MAVYGPITVTTTGNAGVATGTADLPFDLRNCLLEAIKIDYHASAPDTSDVTIAETTGLARSLLVVSNNKTDGTYYPRHAVHDAVGAAGAGVVPYIIEGPIRVSVAQCDALTNAVQVWLQVVENPNVR
jgi:hypothetical protein